MTKVMAVDGVTSFLPLKDLTNACKHLGNRPNFDRISSDVISSFIVCSNQNVVLSFIVCSNQNRLALAHDLLSFNSVCQ